mmetsp:Transcript_30196/g.28847  ORF Transcript_30196/g.28847 Transcript_30196/m.28847 type:complete len:112 (+) Transcript_30196:59-394(+)
MADQFEFPPLIKSAQTISLDVLTSVLKGNTYSAGKTAQWIDTIGNNLLIKLKDDVSPNFKYIISSIIVQKLGAGLHFESAALWDATTDGSVTAKFENETMTCICTIIGIAL